MIQAIVAAGLYPDSHGQGGKQWIADVCFDKQLFTALAAVMTDDEGWDLEGRTLTALDFHHKSFVSVLPMLLRAGLRTPAGFHMTMLQLCPSVDNFIQCMSAFRAAGVNFESRRKNVKVLHDVLRCFGKAKLRDGWEPGVVIQSFIDAGVEVDKGALKIAMQFNLFTCAQRISNRLASMY